MYLPPQFKAKDPQYAIDLMRSHPFAQLISNDDDGLPYVTPLPLHVLEDPSTSLTPSTPSTPPTELGAGSSVLTDLLLLGHCAKPNPHWQYLTSRPEAIVTFMGPHAYMTPRVYPDLARVPTWNYVMVHCTVEAKIIEHFDDKDRLLKHLIADHDPAYADQWRGLGADYQHKMMGGIVAFELKVLSLQCKVKLNQHRPEARAAMHALYAEGTENERALADWMDKMNAYTAS